MKASYRLPLLLLAAAVAVVIVAAIAVSTAGRRPAPTVGSSSPPIAASPSSSSPAASPTAATGALSTGSLTLEAYRNPTVLSGAQLFGLHAAAGASIHAPIAGRVFLRTSSSDPGLPPGKTYGYLTITAPDKTQVAIFLAEVGADDRVLVADQETISAGKSIVTVIGTGPSVIYYSNPGVTPYQLMGYWRDPSGKYLDLSGMSHLFDAPGG